MAPEPLATLSENGYHSGSHEAHRLVSALLRLAEGGDAVSEAQVNLKSALHESMRLNGDIRRKGESVTAQNIINVLLGLVLAVFGWMGNTLWTMFQTQQQQFAQLSLELAKNYMPRVELQQQLDRMASQLERIDRQTRK